MRNNSKSTAEGWQLSERKRITFENAQRASRSPSLDFEFRLKACKNPKEHDQNTAMGPVSALQHGKRMDIDLSQPNSTNSVIGPALESCIPTPPGNCAICAILKQKKQELIMIYSVQKADASKALEDFSVASPVHGIATDL